MRIDLRTFVDASILIIAARAVDSSSHRALSLLDENREFISSPFIRLEVLPKAVYYRNQDEVDFYHSFFEAVTHWVEVSPALLAEAGRVATSYGLSALDALHIAAALSAGAEEFITTEKANKPLHRVTELKITALY
jgi:predicted nucleic acid-binding protein